MGVYCLYFPSVNPHEEKCSLRSRVKIASCLYCMPMFCLQMSHNFSEVFKQLVPHGKATLVMKTDPVEQAVRATYLLLFLNLL